MLDLKHYYRCIDALERASQALTDVDRDSVEYELFRSAAVKEYELIVEQAGKLLRKALRPWLPSKRALDRLTYKDVFRHGGKYGLLSLEGVERWLQYRDLRNELAHDYGVLLAEEALKWVDAFIQDARALGRSLEDAAQREG